MSVVLSSDFPWLCIMLKILDEELNSKIILGSFVIPFQISNFIFKISSTAYVLSFLHFSSGEKYTPTVHERDSKRQHDTVYISVISIPSSMSVAIS